MSGRDPVPIIAPLSRVDRVAGRAVRQSERQARAQQRRRPTQAAAKAHQALVERLTLCHQTAFECVNWQVIVDTGPVAPAMKKDAHATLARRELAEYRPSIVDSLLGLEADKRRKLTAKVIEAAKADAEAYGRAVAAAAAHNQALKLAPGVMAMQSDAIAGAMRANSADTALKGVVEGFHVAVHPGERLVVLLDALEYDALPDEACQTGASGAPAFAEIPPAKRRQLHLDNVCSVTLRAAVEALQVAPAPAVEVVARLCRLGGQGEAEFDPILYVNITAVTLAKLDLTKLEAAPAVAALKARIDWDSARGFAPIRTDDLDLGEPHEAVTA